MEKQSPHTVQLPLIQECRTNSPEESSALGERIGAILETATFALIGDLGAGKTLFSRALCVGAGVDPDVISSPTFTLINEYEGKGITVHHMDTYRLDPESFIDLGVDELLAGPGLKLIEWAERIEGSLLPDTLFVYIEHETEYSRSFSFRSADSAWKETLAPAFQ